MIHAAQIVNADGSYRATKPGEVFQFLDKQLGWVEEDGAEFLASPWFSSWQLTERCKTAAIGTRVSEIRAWLPGGKKLCQAERLRRYEIQQSYRSGAWFYRLVCRPAVTGAEQMALAGMARG